MSKIIPIKQMWSRARLVFFTDTSGEIHDCTGDIVSADKNSITLNNRKGGQLEIPRQAIIWQEVIE